MGSPYQFLKAGSITLISIPLRGDGKDSIQTPMEKAEKISIPLRGDGKDDVKVWNSSLFVFQFH